jgi:NAD(P)-dependent dehydrogenase (short-subunit alcohol dehydrogenase family)
MNKCAVVTGASTGIGFAIAEMLCSNEYDVLMIGRNSEKIASAAATLHSKGHSAFPVVADLRKLDAIDSIQAEVDKKWGKLDTLVNAAGVWHGEDRAYAGVPLIQTPPGQIDEVLDVNIRAPMQLTRALLPALQKVPDAKIISISGTFASGGAGWLHYYVSKLALEHFTVGLSQELRANKIQVNCISPSDTNTEALRQFFPDDAKGGLHPRDIADLAAFLICGPSQHITGQIIVIKNRDA